MTVLGIEHVSGGYGGEDVLRDVSLTAGSGHLTVLLGPNGAGKTTLLRTIAGTLRPRLGQIMLDGNDVTPLRTPSRVRSGITLVPQGRQLFPDLTVKENLVLGAYCTRREVDTHLEEVYTLFDALRGKQGDHCSSLSGGQQQMLAVGRGLMANPRVLLLDEPCLGVAPILRRTLYLAAQQIARTREIPVIAAEQEVALALEFSEEIAVLRRGRVVSRAKSSEVSADDEWLTAAYLGLEPVAEG